MKSTPIFQIQERSQFKISTRSVGAVFAALLLSGMPAQGANLTWDPLLTPATGSDGSGTWGNAAPVSGAAFSNGTADVIFSPTVVAPTTASTTIGSATIALSPANSALLATGQAVSSTAFPAGTTILSIDTGTGIVTMNANATVAINSATSLTFAPNDSAIFGSGTGAAGTVTVSGTQGANSMTINAAGSGNYTFSGGTIILGTNNGATGILTVNSSATINSVFNQKGITFATAGQTLTLGGGSTAFLNGTAGGSSTAIATASTLALTGGAYAATTGAGHSINLGNPAAETGGLVIGSGATVTAGGTFQTGNSGNGLITINSGGALNMGSGGNLVIGRSGANVGKLVISGGALNLTGTTPAIVGFQFGSGTTGNGTLNLTAGSLSTAADLGIGTSQTVTSSAVVNISGGTASVARVNFGQTVSGATTFPASSAGTGALNVTRGSLYIGSGGIVNNGTGTFTSSIALSGGTVGANANWTSSLPITLGTTGGNITFAAANAAGTGAFTIGLSGVLSGPGGLKTSGIGAGSVITLSGANTYAGPTLVGAGSILVTDATGVLGAGNVSVASTGTLTLGNFNSINNLGDLSVFADSTVNLNFAGSETVHTLFDATTGTFLTPATYTVAQLNAIFGGTTFVTNSSGTLTVTAVPEPGIWGLLVLGGVFFLCQRRRTAAQR